VIKTKTLVLDEEAAIEKAVSVLKKGRLIIYPTETQYGIGADAGDRKAVKKIFSIKQRPVEKNIIWAFSDVAMVKKYFSLDKDQEKLVRQLMPGPFTLVMNGQAFRIPANRTARKIIKKLGRPITTTSANISGKETPVKIRDVIKIFNRKVDMIIDGGDLKKSLPSTIFRWEDKKILRKGPVMKKEIMKILKEKRK
jgi:L-threonylcarbamoyladenylate synthase